MPGGGGVFAAIKQDVGHIANKIARYVAQVASEDLLIAHRDILNSYYAGYTPHTAYSYAWVDDKGNMRVSTIHGYNRTGNLRNSKQSKGVRPSGAHSFIAGIEVSAAGMSDYTNTTGLTFPAEGVLNLIWDRSIRGLPPGYRGHIGEFSISASPVGIGISGSPDEAMVQFIEAWGGVRGGPAADAAAASV